MFDLNYVERWECRDSADFKSPFQMCRHERNSVTSQLDDYHEPECNLYKYGVESRHIPSHQAVEFWAENDPVRMEAAFLHTQKNRRIDHYDGR